MKDKIINIKNGIDYYVLNELDYNSERYIYAVECNLEKDCIDEYTAVILKLKIVNNQIFVEEILDDNIAKEVTIRFQKKFQEESKIED